MKPTSFFKESTRILVPVRLPDPEPLSPWLIEFLGPLAVTIVGCYLVKDQLSPEQARDQFEDDAKQALQTVVAAFEDEGAEVESTLVFTHDVVETIDRMEKESAVDLVIMPAEVDKIANLLAVVTEDVHLDRLQRCISALLEGNPVPVTLLHVAREQADQSEKEEKSLVLDGLKERLIEDGIDAERIDTRSLEHDEPQEKIIEISRKYDVVIMDENETDMRDQLLREAPSPVIVVRPRTDDDED